MGPARHCLNATAQGNCWRGACCSLYKATTGTVKAITPAGQGIWSEHFSWRCWGSPPPQNQGRSAGIISLENQPTACRMRYQAWDLLPLLGHRE